MKDSITEVQQQIDAVRSYCQKNLSVERYKHVTRVVETMQELNQCKHLALANEQILLAGYGHDIARELPGEVSELLARRLDRKLETWELEFKLFCHNKAGIYILQEYFGIKDQEVFQAIEHHTLGASGLGTLAKVLYTADFLEPKRPYLKPSEREAYFAMDFETIVYEVCLRTTRFLQSNAQPILPPTLNMLREGEAILGISIDEFQ